MNSLLALIPRKPSLLRVRNFSQSPKKRRKSLLPNDGRSLQDFVAVSTHKPSSSSSLLKYSDNHANSNGPLTSMMARNQPRKSFHIKTYGCQMNVNDTDIVRALLLEQGWQEAASESDANLLLTNTCAIREGAERKVWQRLKFLKKQRKIVGVLGCMAERLSDKILEDGLADLVVGPDAYRELPSLANELLEEDDDTDLQLSNIQLSLEETYADIAPVRARNSVSAFLSIQRGCANRCSFCIVPFTRGQERSRPFDSILGEVHSLVDQGVKEITLLGQNVNSYHDVSSEALKARPESFYSMSNDGFRSRIQRQQGGYHFADLVEAVSDVSPELRVRFTSPHPKDYPPSLLHMMAERPNVCNHLHMPAQSGSSSMLKRMKRGYTREAYLELIESIHDIIPDVAISTDMIAGFCGETDDEHNDSVSLMNLVRYDQAFLFAYSLREKTLAERTMKDDVPAEVKNARLQELIAAFQRQVQLKNEEKEVGRIRLVLLEGESKRSVAGDRKWSGRTDQNKRIVVPVDESNPSAVDHSQLAPLFSSLLQRSDLSSAMPPHRDTSSTQLAEGDYAACRVTEAKGHTLRGEILWRSSIKEFASLSENLHSIFAKDGTDGSQKLVDWFA